MVILGDVSKLPTVSSAHASQHSKGAVNETAFRKLYQEVNESREYGTLVL